MSDASLRQRLLALCEEFDLTQRSDDSESRVESRLSELMDEFTKLVPHPCGAGLIVEPDSWGLRDDATNEEIVDAALGWQPHALVMIAERRVGHPSIAGKWFVRVCVPGTIRTAVVTKVKVQEGARYLIALSGVKLPDGRVVQHGFVGDVFTAGELLSPSDLPAGTVVDVS